MKRILSMVIVLCMITGMMAALPLSAFAEETVTRAEWISGIVETFSMSVEEDANLPDNYFGDITEDMDCYKDILLAVEFGVIDLAAGEDFKPDDPATREFAASTLNYALGYQLGESPEYTYAEASEVTNPDDIQVAINRGWFALSGSNFMPEQSITTAERDAMLSDAKSVLEASVIDENYESKYEFAEGVIVVPDGTDVSIAEDNTVTITDYESNIKVGDIFVVFSSGIPVPFVATGVSVTDNITTITATDEGAENAILSADSEGVAEVDLENFVAQDVETYSVTNTETDEAEILSAELQDISYDKKTKTLKASKKIKLSEVSAGSISIEVSEIELSHQEHTGSGYYEAFLTGKTTVTKTISFDFGSYVGIPNSIILGYVPLEGIGDIKLEVEVDIKGGMTEVQEGVILAGFSYQRGDGFRILSNYQETSYSFAAEAEVKIGLKLSLNINLIFVEGSVWAAIGVKGTYNFKDYTFVDGERPLQCETIKAYLYAEVGVYASINYIVDKQSWNKTHKILDEDNSPARVVYHYEDDQLVDCCTRTKTADNSNVHTKYTTKTTSKYFNPSPSYSKGSYTNSSGATTVVWTYTLDSSNNATITGYKGSASAIAIPSKIDGYTVIKIGNNAFKGNTNLRSVTMADTVTEIGYSAFQNCSNLRYVDLSNSLKKLNDYVFSNCASLNNITIPKTLVSAFHPFGGCSSLKNVTIEDGIEKIPSNLFINCPGIEEIAIPDTVTEIGYSAFQNCSNLRYVDLSNSLEKLNDYVFSNCASLNNITIPKTLVSAYYPFGGCSSLKNVTIEDGIEKIPSNLFINCPGIEEITIPNTVTEIGYSAFQNCTNLRYVDLSNSLEKLDDYVFSNCANLNNITIPKTLVSAFHPFGGCSSLKNVTIENGIEKIPSNLFINCPGIEEITIPDTVTEIGSRAFNDCTNLITVSLPDTIITMGSYAFAGDTNLITINIPKFLEKLSDGVFLNCTSLDNITIPKTLKEVSYYAPFDGCSSLKNVTIENGMEKIPANLLRLCNGIEKITIPGTVTEIGSRAFNDCTNLITVSLPDTIITMGSYAFAGDTNLITINIPKFLEKLSDGVFLNCTSLDNITIPKTLKEVSYYAPFDGCSSLKNITIESGMTKIPANLLRLCNGIEEVTIPDTVTEIGSRAFNDCTNLITVSLPDTIITMGSYAFAGDTNLITINIPKFLEKLSDGVFLNCTSLDNITIPKTLKEVSYYAPFDGCSSLKNITIESGMTKIPANLLRLCNGIEEVTIPDTVTEIGSSAFYDCSNLKSINLPKDLSVIENHLFYGCASLESIDIHNNITEIKEWAFEKSGLKEVTIPDSVTKMSQGIFYDSKSLEKVRLPENFEYISNDLFNNCTSLKDIVLPESIKKIQTGAFKYCKALEEIALPDGLTEIWGEAFRGSGLKEIDVPSNVTLVDSYAFMECSALTSATINSGRLGSEVFRNCDALVKAEINATGTVGNSLFYDCDALESITIGDKVTSIGTYLCYHCDKLTDINLGMGLTSIPANAFRLCESLETVTIPRFVTTIAEHAFAENTNLTTAYLPASVTSMQSTSFSYPNIMTMYGKAGSYAQEHADERGFPFVTIDAPITTLVYPEKEIRIARYETFIPDMSFVPEFDTDTVTFTPSDSNIVTVSASGAIYGNRYGTTTVAMAAESGLSDTITVTVVRPASSLTLNKTVLDIPMNTSEALTLTVSPNNSTDDIIWSSDNTEIAIVDNNGNVTALKEGTANITAKAVYGNKTATCLVTVVASDVEIVDTTGIELNESECEVIIGNKYPLKAKVLPSNATNKLVEWSSSNSNVASVENGVITAKTLGTATITAKTVSGGFTASCKVTVIPKVEITSFNITNYGHLNLLSMATVNAPSDAVVYIASYDTNGRLLEIQKLALTNGAASGIFGTTNVDKYKAFIWRGNKPVSEPKECEL